jgi:hypothetical protein
MVTYQSSTINNLHDSFVLWFFHLMLRGFQYPDDHPIHLPNYNLYAKQTQTCINTMSMKSLVGKLAVVFKVSEPNSVTHLKTDTYISG